MEGEEAYGFLSRVAQSTTSHGRFRSMDPKTTPASRILTAAVSRSSSRCTTSGRRRQAKQRLAQPTVAARLPLAAANGPLGAGSRVDAGACWSLCPLAIDRLAWRNLDGVPVQLDGHAGVARPELHRLGQIRARCRSMWLRANTGVPWVRIL